MINYPTLFSLLYFSILSSFSILRLYGYLNSQSSQVLSQKSPNMARLDWITARPGWKQTKFGNALRNEI